MRQRPEWTAKGGVCHQVTPGLLDNFSQIAQLELESQADVKNVLEYKSAAADWLKGHAPMTLGLCPAAQCHMDTRTVTDGYHRVGDSVDQAMRWCHEPGQRLPPKNNIPVIVAQPRLRHYHDDMDRVATGLSAVRMERARQEYMMTQDIQGGKPVRNPHGALNVYDRLMDKCVDEESGDPLK